MYHVTANIMSLEIICIFPKRAVWIYKYSITSSLYTKILANRKNLFRISPLPNPDLDKLIVKYPFLTFFELKKGQLTNRLLFLIFIIV